MELLENLKWRYATKQYDSSKKVSDSDLEKIKEAIQLSASSYGLQLFKVLIIEDAKLREKLRPASWNQPQITDASHLLVFCNYLDVSDESIDEYMQLKSETNKIAVENLAPYGDFIKVKMKEKSAVEKSSWTARQTYIALSNALNACAELKIDSTPIEGFEANAYSEILGLKEKGLEASVLLTVGYRSNEDATQHSQKVRKPKEKLFEVLK